jgi:hypothetical protein
MWKLSACLATWSLVFALAGSVVGESTDSRVATGIVGASSVSAVSVLNRMDVAFSRGVVCGANGIRGELGERLASSVVSKQLAESGNWLPIGGGAMKFGQKNGLDLIYVKFDSQGNPCGLMTAEVKWNTSRGGVNVDGSVQGTKDYNEARLVPLAKRYQKCATTVQQCKRMPSGIKDNHKLAVRLKNGQDRFVWRREGVWYADCDPSELAEVKSQMQKTGAYVAKRAATGDYRRRWIRVSPDGDDIVITFKYARGLDKGLSEANLNLVKREGKDGVLRLKNALKGPMPADMKEWIADKIGKEFPGLSKEDVNYLADEVRSMKVEDALRRHNIRKAVLKGAAAATAVSMAFDLGFQVLSGEPINWGQTAIAGVSGLASYGTGVGLTHALMKSPLMAQLAKSLNCSTRVFSSVGSSFGAGAVFSVAYPTLMYLTGYMDATTAVRTGIAGVVGAGASAVATTGAMAAVGAYGTASTGTAIASLSGAAAQNATLAWFGGGAASAGGFGTAGGVVVLTAGVAIVAIAVTAVVMYGFQLWDAHQNAKDISDLSAFLDSKGHEDVYWYNKEALRSLPAM